MSKPADQLENETDEVQATQNLSLADIDRARFNPWYWGVYLITVLVAIIAPYWVGRNLAVYHTQKVVDFVSHYSVQGIVFVSWLSAVVLITGIGMAIVEYSAWLWRIVFVVGLAFEQLIAGLCLLNFRFWNSSYVIYGDASSYANAANLGIMSAGIAVATFAILFVGLLVLIPKKSVLNVLTKSWAAFILLYSIQVLALLIVLFGGFLSM